MDFIYNASLGMVLTYKYLNLNKLGHSQVGIFIARLISAQSVGRV